MNFYIKIVLLAGLVHCIVLYGGDKEGKASPSFALEEMERGGSAPERRRSSNRDSRTRLYDPSSPAVQTHRRDNSRDSLLADASHRLDTPRLGTTATAEEAFVNRIPGQESRAFARNVLAGMSSVERQHFNGLLAASPRNRGRSLSADDSDPVQPVEPSNKEKLTHFLLEQMQLQMKQQKELHDQKIAFLDKQGNETFKQTADIAAAGAKQAQCGMGMTAAFSLAGFALSLASFISAHK